MSVRVLLRDYPHRTIALATDDHALVFRHSPSTTDGGFNASTSSLHSNQSGHSHGAPQCMVEFSTLASLDLGGYRSLSSAQGTLGLITLHNDVFLCVVTGASKSATVRPGETVQRIHSVQFYCLNHPDYDHELENDPNNYMGSSDEFEFEHRESTNELPFFSLKKLLSGGDFYYSVDFNLTTRLQDRSSRNETAAFDVESLDEGLLWNSYMIGPLLEFRSRLSDLERQELDSSRILTSVIRGFVKTLTLPAAASPLRSIRSNLPSTLTLISRLSSRRAGTRFNSRGIDDAGDVANFTQTETVFWSPSGLCFSYTQIRGSVPIFWEQTPGLIPGQQKIQITRSPEATQPAFDKHFERLELAYGAIHVINLLSALKPGEAELTQRYRYHLQRSPLRRDAGQEGPSDHLLLRETEFDFHAETKGSAGYEGASMIRHLIEDSADGFAYYMSEEVSDDANVNSHEKHELKRSLVVLQQEGVFRTNCLDCLDRTNLVQTLISQMALECFLTSRGERASSDFWMRHSSLWADNGDALSKIYAGTGALKSSFTRHGKMSLAGALADARKSATRLYVNNFADKGRQNTIDLLLGRLMGQTPVHLFDPINDYVTAEMNRRAPEYTSSKPINIWVGTFNLNGRSNGVSEDLSAWICPNISASRQDPEIVAVGFQEIVELSPQQIMSTDPARRQTWEDVVKRTLNENAKRRGSDDYILLRSGQLVGAALLIFVKAHVLGEIKNVEGSIKKTGLSGIAGNKGAVAIRLDYSSTRICFITAHLAAGFANYEERNRDYKTISHGLRFQKNRSIEDHDSIIWLGDFNYRIGLEDKEARKLIKMGDLNTLYMNDQLNLQMVAGIAFPFYSEARITFLPTYKYNVGSDEYDSSEKSRIPAWCDRVLRKGTNLRQFEYTAAPLRFSDHRPVYATFECTISTVNEAVKDSLSREIYERRRLDVGDRTANADSKDSDDEEITGYDSIAPGLPPASSDRRKWWLDNGVPVRSDVKPPTAISVPNPQRPPNPFSVTDEPDWVQVSRPSSTEGNRSRHGSIRSVAPTPATRSHMVAPPWQGSRSVTNSSASSRNIEAAQDDRPSLPDRKVSTTSISSSISQTSSKKPAPPIPKKPTMLSSQPSQQSVNRPRLASVPSTGGVTTSLDEPSPPSPARRATSRESSATTRLRKTTPPPVQPRNVRKLQRNVSIVSTASNNETEEKGPPLPPRRPGKAVAQMNGLMDETDDGSENLASWQPLQPR